MAKFLVLVVVFGLSMEHYDENSVSLLDGEFLGSLRWISGFLILYSLFKWCFFHGGSGFGVDIGSLFSLWGSGDGEKENSSDGGGDSSGEGSGGGDSSGD